ncbi:MAG: hypothetical protein AAFW76_05045, partial [Pseudomonadota bacterium]
MKTMAIVAALLLASPFALTEEALAESAGLRLTELAMPHHEETTGVAIWYPDGGGGDRTVFAQNAVFHGVDVSMGAEVLEGRHPVVLFSHGLGGTIRAQAWLAAGLAKRGAIVVGVNHPNSTWGDFEIQDGIKHWTRVADLRASLDVLLAAPEFEGHIDLSRIMAAGFSYGGWTALSMGGMTGNHSGFVAACEEHVAAMSACALFLSQDANLKDLAPEVWNKSYADPRITHVAAIDPGFVWGLAPSNLEDLLGNVVMIGLGGDDDRMLDTNFDASGLAA